MQFRNEELYRLQEASPGVGYQVRFWPAGTRAAVGRAPACPGMLPHWGEGTPGLTSLPCVAPAAAQVMTTILTTAMHGEKFRRAPGGGCMTGMAWHGRLMRAAAHLSAVWVLACMHGWLCIPRCRPHRLHGCCALLGWCRPVVLSSLKALPDGRSHYRVRTTILFVARPNGFIKAMIDKGACRLRFA